MITVEPRDIHFREDLEQDSVNVSFVEIFLVLVEQGAPGESEQTIVRPLKPIALDDKYGPSSSLARLVCEVTSVEISLSFSVQPLALSVSGCILRSGSHFAYVPTIQEGFKLRTFEHSSSVAMNCHWRTEHHKVLR